MSNFYESDYKADNITVSRVEIDLGNPNEIYKYLTSKVAFQDEYCRDAAMILWKHIKAQYGGVYFVTGPSGCGKTYVWESIKKVYPNIIICDAASISANGWTGNNKVTSFTDFMNPDDSNYIVVFDESDKLFQPRFDRGGANVSADIASEFLKLVDGMKIQGRGGASFDTSKMTFIFCGSFGTKAEEISEAESSTGFGFGQKSEKHVAYERKLTIQDLIDAGVIRELASRAIRICHVRPLSLDDYIHLLEDHTGSPVKLLEQKKGVKLNVSEDCIRRIANNAYKNGLGVRNCVKQLESMIDDQVFESFRCNGIEPEEISL